MSEVCPHLTSKDIPLPWQQNLWDQLNQYRHQDRLPQALLFYGPSGTGKRLLVQTWIQSLLCFSPLAEGKGCGVCQGCILYQTGNHPDYEAVVSAEPGKSILVDQIRTLCQHLALQSQYHRSRIAMIDPADKLNRYAANSLLKTLEETGQDTMIILMSEQPGLLPATIRSRCQKIFLPLPSESQTLSWLTEQKVPRERAEFLMTLGSPLAIRSLDENLLEQQPLYLHTLMQLRRGEINIVTVTSQWIRQDITLILDWFIRWIVNAIRLQCHPQSSYGHCLNLHPTLRQITAEISIQKLCDYYQELLKARELLATSVNKTLLLEQLLIAWIIL